MTPSSQRTLRELRLPALVALFLTFDTVLKVLTLPAAVQGTTDLGYPAGTVLPIGVIELDHPVDIAKATKIAVEHGVWLRPFRDLIYTMPPYITSDEDLQRITEAMVACASS